MSGLPSLSDYDAWDYTGTVTVRTINLDTMTDDSLTAVYYTDETRW